MELSQELFDRLAGCSRMRGDKAGQDRRKARRIPVTVRTTLMQLRGGALGPTVSVRLRDISRTGLGLLHTESWELGTQLVIDLPSRSDRGIWARVVVTRMQPISATLFLVGARFDRLLEGHPAD